MTDAEREAAFTQENREAGLLAMAMIDARKAAGGTFARVLFKAEDWMDGESVGPVWVYIAEQRPWKPGDPIGRPMNTATCSVCGFVEANHLRDESSEGVFALPWQPQSRAETLAHRLDARFEDQ